MLPFILTILLHWGQKAVQFCFVQFCLQSHFIARRNARSSSLTTFRFSRFLSFLIGDPSEPPADQSGTHVLLFAAVLHYLVETETTIWCHLERGTCYSASRGGIDYLCHGHRGNPAADHGVWICCWQPSGWGFFIFCPGHMELIPSTEISGLPIRLTTKRISTVWWSISDASDPRNFQKPLDKVNTSLLFCIVRF